MSNILNKNVSSVLKSALGLCKILISKQHNFLTMQDLKLRKLYFWSSFLINYSPDSRTFHLSYFCIQECGTGWKIVEGLGGLMCLCLYIRVSIQEKIILLNSEKYPFPNVQPDVHILTKSQTGSNVQMGSVCTCVYVCVWEWSSYVKSKVKTPNTISNDC